MTQLTCLFPCLRSFGLCAVLAVLLAFLFSSSSGGLRAEESGYEVVPVLPGAGDNPTRSLIVFSDAEEVINSNSEVSAAFVEEGVRLSYRIEAYGGVVLRAGPLDLGKLAQLHLDFRQVEGAPVSALLQFTGASGARSSFPIDAVPAGEGGVRVIDFGHFTAFNTTLLGECVQVALVLTEGEGVVEIVLMELVSGGDVDMSGLPPVREKSAYPLPKGLGAWCYGQPEFIVREVKDYNERAADEARIRYLFPLWGTLDIALDGEPRLQWHDGRYRPLRQALDKAGLGEVKILPMIDGLTARVSRVPDSGWDAIAREIGALLEDEDVYGIHFDLEPHDAHVYLLFSQLRAYTDKPITAAVAHSTPELFAYTDMAVLMAYDYAFTPANYRRAVTEKIAYFLRHAREGEGLAMIGVPAIATHHEMESSSRSHDGVRTETGFAMRDFVAEAFEATRQLLEREPVLEEVFTGYCVWAIHEPDALHGPSDVLYYFPGHVSPEVWQLIGDRALEHLPSGAGSGSLNGF